MAVLLYFSAFLEVVLNKHLIAVGFMKGSVSSSSSGSSHLSSLVLISSATIVLFADTYILSQFWYYSRVNDGGKTEWLKTGECSPCKKETLTSLLEKSYSEPYQELEYPVVKYLREALYFEVELLQPADPRLELNLEDCWATNSQSQDSLPRWPILING